MMRRSVLLMMMLVLLAPARLRAQGAEPLIGVWACDVFKSTYATGHWSSPISVRSAVRSTCASPLCTATIMRR